MCAGSEAVARVDTKREMCKGRLCCVSGATVNRFLYINA